VAPFTGIFAPEQPFSTFAGQTVTGTWTLKVADDAGADIGSVTNLQLAFCVTP
jgi:subtilisin-like proprotein convertase family protein